MARRGTRRVNKKTGVEYIVGEWCPELVGKVAGYPKDAEAYAQHRARLNANRESAKASGRLTRVGVPNGWRGRKAEIMQHRANARTDAERLVESLTERRVFVPDCHEARIAMEVAVAIIRDPSVVMRDKLVAVQTVLIFTVPKFAQTERVPRSVAEEFLLRIESLKEETSNS